MGAQTQQCPAIAELICAWITNHCIQPYGQCCRQDRQSHEQLAITELVGAAGVFQLVSRRYERGAMLVTSNRAVGEWGSVFGDAVVATAILDRLLHHSHVVTIRGDSYRLREKRRSGLLQKAAAVPQPAPV